MTFQLLDVMKDSFCGHGDANSQLGPIQSAGHRHPLGRGVLPLRQLGRESVVQLSSEYPASQSQVPVSVQEPWPLQKSRSEQSLRVLSAKSKEMDVLE